MNELRPMSNFLQQGLCLLGEVLCSTDKYLDGMGFIRKIFF